MRCTDLLVNNELSKPILALAEKNFMSNLVVAKHSNRRSIISIFIAGPPKM